MSSVMLLGRLLHYGGVCTVFGSLSLLGLIPGFYAAIVYLARPVVFKLGQIYFWRTFDKV